MLSGIIFLMQNHVAAWGYSFMGEQLVQDWLLVKLRQWTSAIFIFPIYMYLYFAVKWQLQTTYNYKIDDNKQWNKNNTKSTVGYVKPVSSRCENDA